MLALFFIALVLSAGNIAHFIIIVLTFDLMYFIYRKGVIRKLLDKLKIDSKYPDLKEQPRFSYQVQILSELEDRQELERQIYNILTVRKLSKNSVRYMSNRIVMELIKEYYDEITCDKPRQELEEISTEILLQDGYENAREISQYLDNYQIADIMTSYKAKTMI